MNQHFVKLLKKPLIYEASASEFESVCVLDCEKIKDIKHKNFFVIFEEML